MPIRLVALDTGNRGQLPAIRLSNIARTVAHWLNIRWTQQPDGQVVLELLQDR